ncbi:MAG: GNAT family N-acetyltransferase, partial [Kineosporiaceae bacterium]
MHIPPWAPVLADSRGAPTMVLRGHRHADIDAVLAQCQDPAFERWTTVPWPYLRSHAEEFVATREQAWTAGRYLALAVEVDGRFAGTVDVRPDGTAAAEVGYG